MEKRKVLLVFLAVCGIYFVASGGVQPIIDSPGSAFEQLLAPVTGGTPFDVGVLMASLIFLAWAFLNGAEGYGLRRSHLLQGVALASALLATIMVGMLLNVAGTQTPLELRGVLIVVSLFQCAVGLLAGFLLACHSESRRLSIVPLALNGGLGALAVMLVSGVFFI